MDQHRTDTETEPTSEQWLELHRAFGRYCEARPWERLANEDVLVVNDPLGHFKGYCVRWATVASPTAWAFIWEIGAC